MKKSRKALIAIVVVLMVGCLAAFWFVHDSKAFTATRTISTPAKITALNNEQITLPTIVILSADDNTVSISVDLSEVQKRFPQIVNTMGLPQSGASQSFEYSDFWLRAEPDGQARGHFHCHHKRYVRDKILGKHKVGEAGMDFDSWIWPTIKDGRDVEFTTTTNYHKTSSGGFVDFINRMTPKKWFSLDGLIRKAVDPHLKGENQNLIEFDGENVDFERLLSEGYATLTDVRFETRGTAMHLTISGTLAPSRSGVLLAYLRINGKGFQCTR